MRKGHTHLWARASMLEALEHSRNRKAKPEVPNLLATGLKYPFEVSGTTSVEFEDGSILVAESEYDSGYSDMTPGLGIEPPSFYVGIPKTKR